jgi:hypothetical protein
MDPELVADAVPFADAVERDPRARRVGDVVVPVVAGRPARHRALLDPVGEPAILRGLQQRHEVLLEVHQVLVHAALLVAADEPAHRIDAEERRRVEHAQQEVVLLLTRRRIVVQQVVEVGEIRQAHAGIRPLRPARARHGCDRTAAAGRACWPPGSSMASGGTSACDGCSAAESWM